MKFVYIDESGSGSHTDTFVMVGLVIDRTKLKKYTQIFTDKFHEIFRQHSGNVKEFKTEKFFKTYNKSFRLSEKERDEFLHDTLKRVAAVCDIHYFALNLNEYQKIKEKGGYNCLVRDYWTQSALFILGRIQRTYCKLKNNKGNSVIIMDHNVKFHQNLSDLIFDPPEWLGEITIGNQSSKDKSISKHTKQRIFDQIINTPFFMKSEHASLIQVADMVAFILRRYVEVCSNSEAASVEKRFFCELVDIIYPKLKKVGVRQRETKSFEFYKIIEADNDKISVFGR